MEHDFVCFSDIMDISCPGFGNISREETSDYGSRETSFNDTEAVKGFCVTTFGAPGT